MGDRALPGRELGGCWPAEPWTWAGGWGLTSGGGQQAQVVETLVTIEFPPLKQEVHHLGRRGLQLGDR